MILYFIFATIIIGLSLCIFTLKKKLVLQEKKIEDFNYFIDNIPFFVDAFDEKGKCILWNKECERIFGWSMDEVNAVENSLALFYPDEEDQIKTLQILQNADGTELIEVYPQTKEGKVIISEWSSIGLPSGNCIAIGCDTTHANADKIKERTLQLNETKQKLAELNTSLEKCVQVEVDKNKEQQKMMILQSRHAQVGETISMIAHQWRQPLNHLSLIIQDAVFQYKIGKLDAKGMQALDKDSYIQIQQMSNTITDFKNFFKADKGLSKINASSAISHVLNIIQPTLDSQNIFLQTVFEKKDIYIVGYSSEFGQAIINIIVNAQDALKDNDVKDRHISIDLKSSEEIVTITIKDNAGGIPEDILEKIFDPYFSTKNQKNGTGLGLYISKIIIEEHMQGSLSIRNDKDGAVCTIIFNKKSFA